jgi:hypothetical protein
MARNYKKEYREYHASEEQKKRRAERNRDRRAAEKRGSVRKGDNKEVDHVGSHRTGSLSGVGTRVISKSANRRRQPKRS